VLSSVEERVVDEKGRLPASLGPAP